LAGFRAVTTASEGEAVDSRLTIRIERRGGPALSLRWLWSPHESRAIGPRAHRVVDVDLSRYFDTIRHDRTLAKVPRRISDGQVLAMVKQFLKSTGDQPGPQGSPLPALLANLALNDLDHLLDRGSGIITYARYLDDMVVLAPNSDNGKAWADRALARIRAVLTDIPHFPARVVVAPARGGSPSSSSS
jgi:hypothetical protein